MAVKTISPQVIEFIWNCRDENMSADDTVSAVLETKFYQSGTRNGQTKGAAILAGIIEAVENYSDEDGLTSRAQIAEAADATVSRVAEIIKEHEDHEAVIAYLDLGQKAKDAKKATAEKAQAEKKAAREAEREAKKAEKQAEEASKPLTGKKAYDEVVRLQEAGELPDEGLLASANTYAKKAKRAILYPEGLPEA